jgi:hypothetical protein
MSAISELSRGGSVAMHWSGTETDGSWQGAAREVGAFEGTVY